MILIPFLIGLLVGSFLNVVIFRLQKKESLFWTRSRCNTCKKVLASGDLIPLVSFVFLAGRCRYCRQPISWQYPAVELATGLLFAGVALRFESAFDITFWLFFAASAVVMVVYDINYQLIPDAILWPFFVGTLFYITLPHLTYAMIAGSALILWQGVQEGLFAGIITGGCILFLVILTEERAMGMGDVPIAASQGILLGLPWGIVALGASFIIGSLVGILLLLVGKATMKTAVPFTPFLFAGLLAAMIADRLSFFPFFW